MDPANWSPAFRAWANRNDDGDMSDGGRTRAEVLEAPEDDEMAEAGFREGYGHG